MLSDVNVKPMLPVSDLAAAKGFYERTLGLKKLAEKPGTAVTYQSGDSVFYVYRSDHAGTNQGTAAIWEVDDVDATVRELHAKGVTFEHYDGVPGTTREGDVHRAGALKIAWFKDPSGNILSVQSKS
jgi:catechol 2,3-dioxygenase-like lactoylglutathione lyase family enzyme